MWIAADPPNFDVHQNSTYVTQHVTAPCYNNLVQYDPRDPKRIIPDLAERWEVSSDGTQYTFHLVPGVNFHDGQPCTSADVKALTLRHVADLEQRIAELAAMRDTLRQLAQHCSGDERPDCPILADIADVPDTGDARQEAQEGHGCH